MNSPHKPITQSENSVSLQFGSHRADEYKKSKGFTRDALSQLLRQNPLEIPIKQNSREVPSLEKSFGNISISHCKDAFILGWHFEEIGVDIERYDRKFNYLGIQKKFSMDHNQSHTSNQPMSRESTLIHWSSIESAIKWQKGSIAQDLSNWILNKEEQYAINHIANLKVKIINMEFRDWIISIAIKFSDQIKEPIICSNIL
tara:strand:+ start:11044 stop:11646 length:603 start_codon:yes stop_codon:yes gene_type:complete